LGEWRYRSTHSLTSALDGGEWSASCPGRFTPRERAHCTHWRGYSLLWCLCKGNKVFVIDVVFAKTY